MNSDGINEALRLAERAVQQHAQIDYSDQPALGVSNAALTSMALSLAEISTDLHELNRKTEWPHA
jgi:hypothetical protein